ncbi:MAG: O-antigen ligase family protein [Candidatus Kapaibacterium sp.]
MKSTLLTRVYEHIETTSKTLSFWSASAAFVIISLLIFPTFMLMGEVASAIIIAGILALSVYILSPKVWLYSVLLSSYFFYTKTITEESSALILFAMAYHASLFAWIFSHVILKRKKLITHWIDLMFMIFLGFLTINGLIALANDVELLFWLKTWQLHLIILYYLPLREICADRKSQTILLGVCTVVLIIQGVSAIYLYKTALSNFKFASQLLYVGVRNGASVFTVASLASLLAVLFTSKKIPKILLLVFHFFCFTVLLISLARAAWVGYAVGVLLMILLLRKTLRIQLLIGILLVSFSVGSIGFIFFNSKATLILNIINTRFTSSAQFATDPSYLSRIYENESLRKGIEEYPLGGGGLQTTHNRYDAISRTTTIGSYAHNNYLGSAEKMGIPLAALFFGILLSIVIRNWRIAWTSHDRRRLFFAISSSVGLVGIGVINFVGSVFDQREGMFLLAIIFAFSAFAYNLDERPTKLPPKNLPLE